MPGFIFYVGASPIDGAPIVGIAVTKSRNVKTGDMVQTYILRTDMEPHVAIRDGADGSICGDCAHRGDAATGRKRTCYVDVPKSVLAIFRAFMRGAYPVLSRAQAQKLLAGRRLRMGSYGDPAMIPAHVWAQLLDLCDGHTGYTHQWRHAWAQGHRDMVMASADSASERDLAHAMGWRTFRVRGADEPLAAREIVCPASPEGGDRRQCINCLACHGAATGAKASVAIIVHGAMARHFATA